MAKNHCFLNYHKKNSVSWENNVQSVIASFCLFFRAFSQINLSASRPTVGGRSPKSILEKSPFFSLICVFLHFSFFFLYLCAVDSFLLAASLRSALSWVYLALTPPSWQFPISLVLLLLLLVKKKTQANNLTTC